MYAIYSLLLGCAMVLATPWWLLQMARHAKYRAGLRGRFGTVPAHLRTITGPVIWIHAVSVGEVLAISTLVKRLQLQHPQYRIVISTTTVTGHQLAASKFGAENVFYFPMDFGFAIRPYLRALHPDLVVLAETEFWPNFLHLARRSGAKIAVVNARISNRSFPRYRRFRRLLTRVLANVSLFLAQSEEDQHRLVAIGADAERVRVGGNLKFEVNAATDLALVQQIRAALAAGGGGPVMVAGSTVEGEEPLVLAACDEVRRQLPHVVTILAPRHKERFEAVAKVLAESPFPTLRRSQWRGEPLAPGSVVLLDTIGELAALYGLADVAFVGGSLVPRGGHNILEPAQHGVPIVIGPHYENFRDIISIFRSADAVRIVEPQNLGQELTRLLMDSSAAAVGGRAAAVVRANTGATERTLQAVEGLLAVAA